jgi:ribosomal protein S27AE
MNTIDQALSSCSCNVCSAKIEFDPSRAGHTIPCPHCGMDTILFVQPPKKVSAAPPLDPRARYCSRCGSVAIPVAHTKGSFLIELLLWLCFLLPGIIYSAWRLNTRSQVCPKCGSSEIIPADSPRAKEIMHAH